MNVAAAVRRESTRPRLWQGFRVAVQFLTRVPVGAVVWEEGSLAGAMGWFPVVGAVLGLGAGELARGLTGHVGASVAAWVAVLAAMLVTGGLHEDGLADCADAFGLRRGRTRTLEILRDSRIGTFGGLALVFSVVGRAVLIAELPAGRVVPVLVAAMTLGRWAPLGLAWLPAARAEDGQGASVAGRVSWVATGLGTLAAIALATVALHWLAFAAVLATAAVTAGCGWFFRRRLGGVTGDCFGAAVCLVELAVLLVGVWR